MSLTPEDRFKAVVAHAKEYGFVFQSSEIYDGLAAVYDYGQNGSLLKNNLKEYWWTPPFSCTPPPGKPPDT